MSMHRSVVLWICAALYLLSSAACNTLRYDNRVVGRDRIGPRPKSYVAFAPVETWDSNCSSIANDRRPILQVLNGDGHWDTVASDLPFWSLSELVAIAPGHVHFKVCYGKPERRQVSQREQEVTYRDCLSAPEAADQEWGMRVQQTPYEGDLELRPGEVTYLQVRASVVARCPVFSAETFRATWSPQRTMAWPFPGTETDLARVAPLLADSDEVAQVLAFDTLCRVGASSDRGRTAVLAMLDGLHDGDRTRYLADEVARRLTGEHDAPACLIPVNPQQVGLDLFGRHVAP